MAEKLAARARQRRLELNMTQRELARRSGVSYGSVKRFESGAGISLTHLLMIALVLRSIDGFDELFRVRQYRSVDEVLGSKRNIARQRASGKRKDVSRK